MKRARGRASVLWSLVGLATLVSAPAEAYYQYVHYLNGNFGTPIYEKYDLTALPNKTVTFFVADSGPQSFGPNDDFSSVISQIEQAAAAWNSVATSNLRVAFGGLETQTQAETTPGGDVVFIELPPGLLGLGGTNVPASEQPVTSPNGPFFPISRSIIQLTANTGSAPGPSYRESFFTTAVHEMGHALGLQHTWTSAAMSQDVIRNTSRARPIDADDRAALSVLYGSAGWTAGYGSISGRVTANGQPVALASVVAIAPQGSAVSALTNPDGSYTINGLPPNNSYLLYVHPLPPDAILPNNAGLRMPVDQNGQALQASGPFFTAFLPDPNNGGQPKNFFIAPGAVFTGQNFSVNPESSVSMYDVLTSSFNSASQSWYTPAYVNSVASIFAIRVEVNPPAITPVPQSIAILGGFGTATICAASGNAAAVQAASAPCFQPYDFNTGQTLPANTSDPATALAIYFPPLPAAGAGPRHLVFTLPNGDLYVLPDAVNLVAQGAPTIVSVTSFNGSVTVTGSNLGPNSTVYFDGAPALAQGPFAGSSALGSIAVTPPPGYSGQNASVIVYNSDGQNSTFYQAQNPPTYQYPVTGIPQITVNTTSLASGASSMVDITAVNMQFPLGGGQVTLGFGSSDVSVRRVWVLSSTHLVANMVVAPNAAIGASEISVISGFQIASQAGGFQVQPANLSLPSVALPIANNDPNQANLYPGAVGVIFGSRLTLGAGGAQVALNGQPVTVLFSSPAQVNFLVPTNFPIGFAEVTVNNGIATAPPVGVEIDTAPPSILGITNAAGQLLTGGVVAPEGQILTATVSNVSPLVAANSGGVQITVSGLPMPVIQVVPGPQNNTLNVSFEDIQAFGGTTVPVVVIVNGTASDPYPILAQ
ncbi:MAG: carboxypeptidase regulatory-like domain-containing protein [Acidobacteriia bacterium]|nr:carboxypeptidase regulatory-like domain-containing protein [Terriglobia bacterium]